jgi:hypothetical protein
MRSLDEGGAEAKDCLAEPQGKAPSLPMRHTALGKLTSEQRDEYVRCLERHIAEHPNYLACFDRLPQGLVKRAWRLVEASTAGDEALKKLARRATAHSVDDRPQEEQSQEAKESFVILLALLVGPDNAPIRSHTTIFSMRSPADTATITLTPALPRSAT